MNTAVGKSIHRKEAWEKVTGSAQYADDYSTINVYIARLLTSTCAHARIVRIDVAKALAEKGVKAVLTGKDCTQLFGPLVLDRPALARDVVRYAGEPVAMVVAQDEPTAERAVHLIEVDYEALPMALTPLQALSPGGVLVHDKVNGYKKVMMDVYPEAGTNIASRYRIRKGDMAKGGPSANFGWSSILTCRRPIILPWRCGLPRRKYRRTEKFSSPPLPSLPMRCEISLPRHF